MTDHEYQERWSSLRTFLTKIDDGDPCTVELSEPNDDGTFHIIVRCDELATIELRAQIHKEETHHG